MSRFNVVLIIADCLRPDLPILGYPRNTTPLLAPHLSRARGYSNCWSTCGWTLPACASIITGRPPADHGLVDHDGRFRVPKLGHFLGPDCFSFGIGNNGNLVPDDIDDSYLQQLGAERNKLWKRFGWNLDFDVYRWFHRIDHDGPFVEAERFLREHHAASQQFLLFFHTNVVHDYSLDRPCYQAVEEWFQGELPAELRSFRDGPEVWARLRSQYGDDYLAHQIKARYDCGIVELDRRLALLFNLIDFERTVVILVGDHGEGFRPDLGRVHHCGRLHDDLLRVPLFVWAPPECGVEAGIDHRVCSTLDIVPTVLALTGQAGPNLPGRCLTSPIAHGHRTLKATDHAYAYLPGSLERRSYDRHHVRSDAELVWPLKRVRLVCDGQEFEQCFNLASDPHEERELLAIDPPAGLPTLSIVVVVNDWGEFDHHIGQSPLRTGGRHQWILLDNTDNRLSGDLCRLYNQGLGQAKFDLVIFSHQDVFFPPGWENDFARTLAHVESLDPQWGVLGPVGIGLDPTNSGRRQFVGHWSDPAGYHRMGELPAKVQSLDEQWLCIRRNSGLAFDEAMPGLHCYGMDLCLTARSRGLNCYAIDAFSWHKHRQPDGTPILKREDSAKITRRASLAFIEEVQPSYQHVARKWRAWYPFVSTSMDWIDPDAPAYRGPIWRSEASTKA